MRGYVNDEADRAPRTCAGHSRTFGAWTPSRGDCVCARTPPPGGPPAQGVIMRLPITGIIVITDCNDGLTLTEAVRDRARTFDDCNDCNDCNVRNDSVISDDFPNLRPTHINHNRYYGSMALAGHAGCRGCDRYNGSCRCGPNRTPITVIIDKTGPGPDRNDTDGMFVRTDCVGKWGCIGIRGYDEHVGSDGLL